jgi:hypothetical protein
MKRREFLKTACLGLAGASAAPLVAAPCSPTVQESAPPARQPAKGSDFTFLILEGGPRERGRAHGETLRASIREVSGKWKESLGRPPAMTPDAYIARFVKDTTFDEAMMRWTPALLEEVAGIAEGSGSPTRPPTRCSLSMRSGVTR